MKQVYALRIAAVSTLLALGVLAEAQVNVYVRLAEASVVVVDSDDVPDDNGDEGLIGDRDEFRWLLRTVVQDQNFRGSIDTVILGRDGDVAGDPEIARFTPEGLDVLYGTTPDDADGLLVGRRYGAAPASIDQISLSFILEGWEDDADLTAGLTYDAEEDDFFDEGNANRIPLEGLEKETWTPLTTEVLTDGGRFGVRVEVYWEDYRAPDFSILRVDAAGNDPAPGERFCAGADRIFIDSDFEGPSVPYDGVTFDAYTILNGALSQSYRVFESFPEILTPMHSGGPLPDTLQIYLLSFTRFGFFNPTFYVSLPSDTVTIIIDPPALPREAVTARTPGLRCANYDGTPVTVTIAEGYDPLDYDYALTSFEDYEEDVSIDLYTEGTRTPTGFVFAEQPDYYQSVLVTPRDGGCPLVIDNPDVEFYEAEYALSWTDVSVTDATETSSGRLDAAAETRATRPWYDSLFPPFIHEYYDPAGAQWVVVDANAIDLDFAIDVPPGSPYRLRITDALGCRLDTAGLTVGGTVAEPTIANVTVFESCGLGAGLATVVVEGNWPDAELTDYFVRGRTSDGVLVDRQGVDGASRLADIPPGRYVVGLYNVFEDEEYVRPDSFEVGTLAPEPISLQLDEQLTCEPFGLAIVAQVITPTGLDQPRYRLGDGPLTAEPTFGNLSAGTYTVTVQDTFFCGIGSRTLEVDPANYQAAIANVTDAGCEPGATGSVSLVPSRGTLFVEYSIDGLNYSMQEIYTNLAPGDYTAFYRAGADGECVTTAPFTIGGGAGAADLLDSLRITDVSCFGEATGAIRLFPAPGAPAAEYSINGGPFATDLVFFGLASDEYTVRAREVGGGCEQILGAFVSEPTSALGGGWEIARTPTCGRANGSFSAFGFGGTPPYTFQWSTGVTGQQLDDAGAGPYALTITDAAGCVTTVNEFVEGSPALELAIVSREDVPCFGESLGRIQVSASEDATYFLGDASNVTGVFGDLAAGDYQLLAIGTADGCRDSLNFRINAPAPLVATATLSQNPSCAGQSATVNVSGAGGTGTDYRYSLDRFETSQASPDFPGLTPGVYEAGVSDENGCFAFADPITVTAPTELSVGFESFGEADCGASTGAVEASPGGGTPPYRYAWSDGQTTQRAVGLPAGPIGLVVTDANGCTVSASFEVGGGPALAVTLVERVDASCGRADGSLRVATSAAAGEIVRYVWSHDEGLDAPLATGLPAGSYTVTATTRDCSASATFAVGSKDGPQLSVTSVTAAACDGTPGGATVTVSGGEGAVTVSWSNGETGDMAFELPAGRSTVTAVDANECVATLAVDVPLADDLRVEYAVTDASCAPAEDGVIAAATALPPGTTLALVGRSDAPVGGRFEGLPPGDYTVAAATPAGCLDTATVTVSQAEAPTVEDVRLTMPSCDAPDGGSIVVVADGSDLRYSIDDGETFQVAPRFDGLRAGTYGVLVQTEAGCTSARVPVVLEGPAGGLAFAITVSRADTCERGAGSFDLTPVGGVAPYTLVLPTGEELSLSADGIEVFDLAAGTVSFTLLDAGGCSAVGTAVIPAYDPAAITTAVVTQPSCENPEAGAITIEATPGTSGQTLAYSIDGGETFQSTPAFTGLPAGSYRLAVQTTPGACLTLGEAVVLVDPTAGGPEIVSEESGSPTCEDPTGGTYAVVAAGEGLSYSLDGGETFQDAGFFTELSAGTYALVIRSAGGCTLTKDVVIEGPGAAPALSFTALAADTCGRASGAVSFRITGGTAPFEVTFAGERYGDIGASGLQLGGLTAGTYEATIRDVDGCTSALQVSVSTLAPPQLLEVATTPPTCGDPSAGRLAISAGAQGNTDLAYSIDGGEVFQRGEVFVGLGVGTYVPAVRGVGDCVTVGEPIVFEIDASTRPVIAEVLTQKPRCDAPDAGSIRIEAAGEGLSYSFDGGETFEERPSREGLSAGVYVVVVRSGAGCESPPVTVTLAAPDSAPAVVDVEATAPTCDSPEGGRLRIIAEGRDLAYSIDGGEAFAGDAEFGGLPAGTYVVVVRNGEGCVSAPREVSVEEAADAPAIVADVTAVDACGAGVGAATVAVDGGEAPYVLVVGTRELLLDVGGEFFLNELPAGRYVATVTDARGCTGTSAFTVIGTTAPTIAESLVTPATCDDLTAGAIVLSAVGEELSYSVDGGQTFATEPAFGDLTAGEYIAVVRSRDACLSAPTLITVGGPRTLPEVRVEGVRAADCGLADGGFTVLPQGAQDLTYVLDGGPRRDIGPDGTQLADLQAGDYTLVVRNGDGCEAAVTVTVPGVDAPVITEIIETPPSCADTTGGRIEVRAEGLDLTYAIDGETFQSSPVFGGLSAGRYEVTVRGRGGCLGDNATVNLNGTAALAITPADVSTTDTDCDDVAGGSISVRILGEGIDYSIDGGQSFQSSADFGGLRAGTYELVVRSQDGCTSKPIDVEVAGPTEGRPDILSVEAVSPACDDLAGGRLQVSVAGTGTGLSYAIDGGDYQDDSRFTGLRAGTYVVRVRTAGGCVTTSTPIELAGPTSVPRFLEVGSTPITCRGASDGTILIEGISGGAPPYRLLLVGTDVVADEDGFRGLPAGEYEVRVTDANGCSAVTTASVGDGPGLGLRLNRNDNPSCGEADGRIEVGASADGVTFAWSDGGSGAVRDGLTAGQYTVTATTPAGCRDTLTVAFVDLGAPRLEVAEVTSASCGEDNGSVTLAANGGEPPFRFDVDGRPASEGVVTDLAPGRYLARVTDARGCVSTANVQVGDVGRIAIAATDTSTCGDGRVEVSARVLQGVATELRWSNGDEGPTTRLRAGESAVVTAISPEGCTATATAIVRDGGAEGEPTVTYAAACPDADGEATTVTVVGFGARDSLYVFDGVTQASPAFANVAPGEYAFGVVLRSGCFLTGTTEIARLAPLSLTVVDTAFVDCAPVVTLVGSGGAGGPYRFSTDGNDFSTANVFPLAGPTTLFFEDARGCRSVAFAVDVPVPVGPSVAAVVDYGDDCGATAAAVTLESDGDGVSYRWPDGFEGARREGLAPGAYDVVATAETGCTTTVPVTVESPAVLGLALGDLSAAGDCRRPDGRATVVGSGGVEPYAYSWSHDATLDSALATGLSAGTYTVALTDARGCREEIDVTVPGELGIRIGIAAVSPVTCAGVGNGTVAVSLTGPDTTDVQLHWPDGSSARLREDLSAGDYRLTATDVNGCVDTVTISVADDRLRVREADITDAGCGSDGAIDLDVAGGAGATRVTWADGLGGRSRLGLPAGTYAVAISDDGGCVLDTSLTVAGDAAVALAAEAITICPDEVRAYGVPYAPADVSWFDETGFLVAEDSVLLIDRAGVFTYEVDGLSACGGQGELTVGQSDDALFAQFLIASAAVAGAEVVAIETSVPAPDLVRWRVSGPGAFEALATTRNEYRWRFDEVGVYSVTLEASRGSCTTTQTKTVTIVSDSTQLPQTVATFGELVDFRVSPNPTAGPFTADVSFTSPRPISVRVYDVGGGLVAETGSPASDTHAVALDIGAQGAGQYYVVVVTGAGSYHKPLVLID